MPFVEVETVPGSGACRSNRYLRPRKIVLGSDDRLNTCTLAVPMSETIDFARVLRGFSDVGEPGTISGVPGLWPTKRVRVRRSAPDEADQTLLFEGFPLIAEGGWGGAPDSPAEAGTHNCLCVLDTWKHDERCQLYGRYMWRYADALTHGPTTTAQIGEPVRATGVPCIFNFEGRPNRHRVALETDLHGNVPLFTDEHDPRARYWSLGQALRYLLHFHRPENGLVDSSAVYALTDDLVSEEPITSGGLSMATLLRGRVRNVRCESIGNLLNAMRVLLDSVGLHFAVQYESGTPTLVMWSASEPVADGATDIKWLHLERRGTDQSDRTPREQLARNNVDQGQVLFDMSAIRTDAIVLGARKRYVCSTELIPGWEPEAGLDDVALDDDEAIAAAKAKAILSEGDVDPSALTGDSLTWWQRYARNASEQFRSRVGRWWVLNEGNDYDALTYGRAREDDPFPDGAYYPPFDFASVLGGVQPGTWAMVRRRFLELPVDRSGSNPALAIAQVIVELSFDAGSTWFRPVRVDVRLPTTECALVLGNEYLTDVVRPGDDKSDDNLWYALIEGRVRMLITAAVMGDERIEQRGESSISKTAWPARRTRTVDAGDQFRHRNVSGNTLHVPINNAAGLDIDDSGEALAAAGWFVAANEDKRISAGPVVPWLETHYRVGDRIAGIAGRQVSFERTLGAERVLPTVVGLVYEFGDASFSTQVVLEDWRGAPHEAPRLRA